MEDTTKKRRRGRPRKYVVVEKKVQGICSTTDPEERFGQGNIIELVCNSASELKKIVNLAQKIKSDNMQFQFTRNEIKILAQDHAKQVILLASINANKVARYFCDRNSEYISIQTQRLYKITSTLSQGGRALDCLAIACTDADLNSAIRVVTIHTNGYRECDWIDIIHIDPDPAWETSGNTVLNIDNYPLKMGMDTNMFKNAISKAMKLSNSIRFEKIDKASPLKITYASQKCTGTGVFPEDGVTIEHTGELVVVNSKPIYIRTLILLILSDYIRLYMDNNSPFVAKSVLNDVFEVIMIIPTNI